MATHASYERPGRVHLDVALPHRRPRADRVEPGDERERTALQVVEAAGADEADLLARDARLLDGFVQDRDDHLGLVVHRLTRSVAAHVRHHRYVAHQR